MEPRTTRGSDMSVRPSNSSNWGAGGGPLRPVGWKPGSFTHVFVDESCQALEAEVLIPLAMAGPRIVRVRLVLPDQEVSTQDSPNPEEL